MLVGGPGGHEFLGDGRAVIRTVAYAVCLPSSRCCRQAAAVPQRGPPRARPSKKAPAPPAAAPGVKERVDWMALVRGVFEACNINYLINLLRYDDL